MTALAPGSTIGILGRGQLGRMLAITAPPAGGRPGRGRAGAAARLGLKCHVYSDQPGPAFDVAARSTVGAFEDAPRIAEVARGGGGITYEVEDVPLAAAAG